MTKPTLTDSHCHLDFPDFKGELGEIISRAEAAGVKRMVSIATTRASLKRVQNIAKDQPQIFYAFGLHPLHVHEEPLITVEELITESQSPKMIAIGETGLDYHYSKETEKLQKESLQIHIPAAQETNLPLVIHARNADEDIAQILSSRHREKPYRCVMHCFSSSKELAETALDCGFYLSMSGVTTFKNAESLREIFRAVPLDRILIETDAPYLAPVPHRGKRNEPAYCAETAKMAASLFDQSYENFAKQTEVNFETLFSKVQT